VHQLVIKEGPGCEWLTSSSCRFTRGNEPRYPIIKRLGGPHGFSGCCGEQKHSVCLPGFQPRKSQSLLYSLYRSRGEQL